MEQGIKDSQRIISDGEIIENKKGLLQSFLYYIPVGIILIILIQFISFTGLAISYLGGLRALPVIIIANLGLCITITRSFYKEVIPKFESSSNPTGETQRSVIINISIIAVLVISSLLLLARSGGYGQYVIIFLIAQLTIYIIIVFIQKKFNLSILIQIRKYYIMPTLINTKDSIINNTEEVKPETYKKPSQEDIENTIITSTSTNYNEQDTGSNIVEQHITEEHKSTKKPITYISLIIFIILGHSIYFYAIEGTHTTIGMVVTILGLLLAGRGLSNSLKEDKTSQKTENSLQNTQNTKYQIDQNIKQPKDLNLYQLSQEDYNIVQSINEDEVQEQPKESIGSIEINTKGQLVGAGISILLFLPIGAMLGFVGRFLTIISLGSVFILLSRVIIPFAIWIIGWAPWSFYNLINKELWGNELSESNIIYLSIISSTITAIIISSYAYQTLSGM